MIKPLNILLLAALILMFGVPANAQVVVANKIPLQNTITPETLRAIFGMRIHVWSDGTPISVFVLNTNNEAHIEFCKEKLKVFPYQLQRTWNRLVFSGTGQAPIQVNSIAEMKAKITSIPGAIGYLPDSEIDETIQQLDVR